MQHKRHRRAPRGIFFVLGGLAALAGLIFLSMANVPPPSKPIEKTLDAKAFLETK